MKTIAATALVLTTMAASPLTALAQGEDAPSPTPVAAPTPPVANELPVPEAPSAPAVTETPASLAVPPPVVQLASPNLVPVETLPAPFALAKPATGLLLPSGFVLTPSGFVRTLFSFINDDEAQTDYVGRYDGFQMLNARLAFEASRDNTTIGVSLEGAYDRRGAMNTSEGSVEVQLRDAFISYHAYRFLHLTAGQLKVPFAAEEATPTPELVFTDMAVSSRGVRGVEGYNADGLSFDRRVGLKLSSDRLYLSDEEGLGLRYALTLSNGNSPASPLNDNETLAYTARLEVSWGQIITLGLGADHNEVTSGSPPDALTEKQLSLAGDLAVDAFGAHLLVQYLRRIDEPKDVPSDAKISAQGFLAQVSYEAPYGLVPAYRFALLDPTVDVTETDADTQARLDTDDVRVHTLGLGWNVPDEPFAVKVNYHLVLEDAARNINNDRLDVLLQGAF